MWAAGRTHDFRLVHSAQGITHCGADTCQQTRHVMSLPDDNERTLIKGGPHVPPAAAGVWDEHSDALPAGTRLHEFEVLSVIGQGGFGIVYLAHDQALDRQVAIKEYMPSSMAVRTRECSVAVRSSRDKDTFAAGLRSFINEARLLARFDHASLLKVHQFWEAQGTAYMVMPYYAGTTLGHLLKQGGKEGKVPNEAQLRAVLMPLLDALSQMHAADCFHRDIAPDNILILPDQQPLLLDFGAARHVIKDMSRAPTVILKNGYAPVEQYGEMPDMRQGAWTDLYALGAVMQYAITGRTPPQAVTRFLQDKREALAVTAAGRYSDAFLRAIDRSLAVLPKDRPQNVHEMRALLAQAGDAAPAAIAAPAVQVVPAPGLTPKPLPMPTPTPAPAVVTAAAPRPRPHVAALVGIAAIVLVALLAWGLFRSLGGRSTPVVVPVVAPRAEQPKPPVPVKPVTAPAAEVIVAPASSAWTPPPLVNPAPATAPVAEPAATPAVVPSTSNKPAAPALLNTPPRVLPPTPSLKSRHARCDDIIARVSLGEELSAADKAILAKECK